jgi:hypothetical protein
MIKLDPSVPWVKSWARARAVSSTGTLIEFAAKPKPTDASWQTAVKNIDDSTDDFVGYYCVSKGWDATNWRQSLEERPAPQDFHTLPCGAKIPSEGIKAWVKFLDHDNWSAKPEIIFAHVGGKNLVLRGGMICYFNCYSLTNPIARRRVTAKEIAGKWVHWSEGVYRQVIAVNGPMIEFNNHLDYSLDYLAEVCRGWSDTAESELKSFWINEQIKG